MTEKTDVIDLTGLLRPHYVLHPSTVLLVASDLFPLAGIAFWHWNTFLLLMLYCMDTAVIAFCMIAQLAAIPIFIWVGRRTTWLSTGVPA